MNVNSFFLVWNCFLSIWANKKRKGKVEKLVSASYYAWRLSKIISLLYKWTGERAESAGKFHCSGLKDAIFAGLGDESPSKFRCLKRCSVRRTGITNQAFSVGTKSSSDVCSCKCSNFLKSVSVGTSVWRLSADAVHVTELLKCKVTLWSNVCSVGAISHIAFRGLLSISDQIWPLST